MLQDVRSAAHALDVDESRVRVMLRAGQLSGRKLGGAWVVEDAEVARAVRAKVPGGRPLSSAKGWAVLDLLDGGGAPWLDAVGRSRARMFARRLAGESAMHWSAALRGRQDKRGVRLHPAALERLLHDPVVVLAGPERAAALGADLVAMGGAPEVYVPEQSWAELSDHLAAREVVEDPDVVVRVPRDMWPLDFRLGGAPGLAMLAADLLDSAEPRAVSAGVSALNGLAVRSPSVGRPRVSCTGRSDAPGQQPS